MAVTRFFAVWDTGGGAGRRACGYGARIDRAGRRARGLEAAGIGSLGAVSPSTPAGSVLVSVRRLCESFESVTGCGMTGLNRLNQL